MCYKSSLPGVFLRKDITKISSKFTGEHPCRSLISIKMICTSTWVFCCISRAPFCNNISGELLPVLVLLLVIIKIRGWYSKRSSIENFVMNCSLFLHSFSHLFFYKPTPYNQSILIHKSLYTMAYRYFCSIYVFLNWSKLLLRH